MSTSEWSGLTVVVTGACGGYGAFLVRSLVTAGAYVRAVDLRKDDHLDFLAHAEARGKAKFIKLNLAQVDVAPIQEVFTGVDAVFHTVAFFGNPPFGTIRFGMPGSEALMRQMNQELTERLLLISKECAVKAFVYTSSFNAIFSGRQEVIDATEDMPYLDPQECFDLYTISKTEAERLVVGANGKAGLYTASVRPNGIWGPTLRLVVVRQLLEQAALTQGWFLKFLDKAWKEPVADWCHVENLALVQMVVCKHLLARNPIVCGGIYNASDDRICTMSEFFAERFKDTGWVTIPIIPVPAMVLLPMAHMMEAACYCARRLTGMKTIIPPITRMQAAKATLTNSQVVEKAKRDLGFIPLPDAVLMKDMPDFIRQWSEQYAHIPAVSTCLWMLILPGVTAVIGLSLADVRRLSGAPWKFIRSGLAFALPGVASMPLEIVQRKVCLIGICMPMVGLHAADAVIAAYIAANRGHLRWVAYSFRTLLLGIGQLQHLLSSSHLKAYPFAVVAAFGASAIAAACSPMRTHSD